MRPDFRAGATNATSVCLGITRTDRVAVIRNAGAPAIADAIEEQVSALGAVVSSWNMDEVLKRPVGHLPAALGQQLREFRPTASYYIGNVLPGEVRFRQELIRLITVDLRCRHGHMPGIDERLMLDGMAADYDEIYRITRAV